MGILESGLVVMKKERRHRMEMKQEVMGRRQNNEWRQAVLHLWLRIQQYESKKDR